MIKKFFTTLFTMMKVNFFSLIFYHAKTSTPGLPCMFGMQEICQGGGYESSIINEGILFNPGVLLLDSSGRKFKD